MMTYRGWCVVRGEEERALCCLFCCCHVNLVRGTAAKNRYISGLFGASKMVHSGCKQENTPRALRLAKNTLYLFLPDHPPG